MSQPLDYHDALTTLLATHTSLPGTESVPLAQLQQRVLAWTVPVQHDVPAFDNSAMDGYALGCLTAESWQVVQRIAAGDAADVALQPGEAARIFTGAPVPPGTQAVLIQENAVLDADGTRLRRAAPDDGKPERPLQAGQNIRRQAEELQRDTPLLSSRQRLTPALTGLLAGQGYAQVPCLPRVRVTVFSSGNELVEPGQPLQPGQIYDSNRHMLLQALREQGFAVIDGGRLPDQLDATRTALRQAATQTDAILCSGGVSVGEEDHLKAALADVGELTQWRLFIKPGKPFSWGHIGACRVFMLPGNPVSSLVTFHLLALPALRRMAGLPEEQARPWQLQASADFSRERPEPRREFLRATLQATANGYQVRPVALQGSAMLSGAANAQALAEIPPGALVQPGQMLTVYPLLDRF